MQEIDTLKKGRNRFIIAVGVGLLSLFLCGACNYSYKIMVMPTDAWLIVDSERITAGKNYLYGVI